MNEPIRTLTLLPEYAALEGTAAKHLSAAVFGVDTQKIYFAALISARLNKRAFLVVADEKAAREAVRTLDAIGESALLFPAKEAVFRDVESVSRFEENQRIETLSHIRRGQYRFIVIPAQAACTLTVPPSENRETVLIAGKDADYDALPTLLTDYGYEACNTVEGPGQFCLRGSILDVFPPSEDAPYRVEFFDRTVDTVSLFDVGSQRRTEPKDLVRIPPAKEFTRNAAQRLIRALESLPQTEKVTRDLALAQDGFLPRHDRYLPAYYSEAASVLDYRAADDLLFLLDYRKIAETWDAVAFRIDEDITRLSEEGYRFLDLPYYFTRTQTAEKCRDGIAFETLTASLPDFSPRSLYHFNIYPTANANLQTLPDEIERYLNTGYRVTVITVTEDHRRELLRQYGSRGVTVLCDPLPFGFELPDQKTVVLSLRQKGETRAKRKKSRYGKGEAIKAFSDIQPGDYVVHEDFGVGIYDGIHKLTQDDTTKDFIKIRFAGTDVLYVPCSNLDVISKYIGGSAENTRIKLNRLGGTDWQKAKQQTRRAVRDLADQLILLYGKRLKTKGHAFAPDNDWQKNFEESFEFEETEDQLRCTEEIKADMEKPIPMDRLLCGDVGFGKTEVALRAVFKCVMDSKQAAILAPTTLLAYQHYNTVRARFRDYPIRVELLSRFRTAKQQEAILKRLRRGEVDVIIGTHRLLQKDTAFRDLGLIVIDEEQRFGVSHKEYLKEKALDADILSLSATPIPRTLNMSLSGIRDISVINEAPGNRYPITTYVSEYSDGLVCDAIRREISRGGQCYYLHNRIETIYRTAQHIEERTGARVGVAHGKMTQEELSGVWQDLVEGAIDVLVCTTIIETGVDVPNCNTLIIDDADRLGLAQLHQIRGRVGRTDRRAYAYFTFRTGKVLSGDAYKRLMTIKEFTEFGSGLKIAMRDLEIRGAGNVLGAEQSGHLASVGFDMYMKLLEEAVREQRGEASAKHDCTVEFKLDAYLPDDYIRDPDGRIEIYKRISCITGDEDESDVIDELIDRYGAPPPPVENLLFTAKTRYAAAACGIRRITEQPNGYVIFPENVDLRLIAELAAKYRRRFLFSAAQTPYITLKCDDKKNDITQFLSVYTDLVENTKQA